MGFHIKKTDLRGKKTVGRLNFQSQWSMTKSRGNLHAQRILPSCASRVCPRFFREQKTKSITKNGSLKFRIKKIEKYENKSGRV